MVSLGAALVVAAASAQTPPAPPSTQTAAQVDDPFPDGPGKSTFMKVCGNCHEPDKVVGPLKTRAEWSQTLDDMARLGAEATDQEFTQIHEYLVAHFSPISVNKASAKELAAALDVPPTVADAIVKYRDEQGPFTSLDDLKKVPGLEAAKVDALKKRLVFQAKDAS
jgi:competence protein ComEA